MKITHNIFKILPIILILFLICSCQIKDKSETIRPFELDEISIAEIQEGYKSGKYSVAKIVQLYINRIKEIDKNGPKLNSVIMVNPDALKIADSLDAVLKSSTNFGPMFGIPVILKDHLSPNQIRVGRNSMPLMRPIDRFVLNGKCLKLRPDRKHQSILSIP